MRSKKIIQSEKSIDHPENTGRRLFCRMMFLSGMAVLLAPIFRGFGNFRFPANDDPVNSTDFGGFSVTEHGGTITFRDKKNREDILVLDVS